MARFTNSLSRRKPYYGIFKAYIKQTLTHSALYTADIILANFVLLLYIVFVIIIK